MDNPSAEHQATDLVMRTASGGSEADRYYYVRAAKNINMTGWNTLWIRGQSYYKYTAKGFNEAFVTWNAVSIYGCPWEYHAYWRESFKHLSTRSSDGILYEVINGWYVAKKSELKRNGVMNGQTVVCISCYNQSSQQYGQSQPTLYWRCGL